MSRAIAGHRLVEADAYRGSKPGASAHRDIAWLSEPVHAPSAGVTQEAGA
ncbi:hypothetical protein IB242_16915 [Xanthomonas sp. XNM01]|nr:hypothetical protein [Xanthomonas sp. XNM01]